MIPTGPVITPVQHDTTDQTTRILDITRIRDTRTTDTRTDTNTTPITANTPIWRSLLRSNTHGNAKPHTEDKRRLRE